MSLDPKAKEWSFLSTSSCPNLSQNSLQMAESHVQKDFFDTMINDAIEDLRKSGLEDEEIITIISQEFGTRYLHHLLKATKQAGAR